MKSKQTPKTPSTKEKKSEKTEKMYENISVKKMPKAEVEINGSISTDVLSSYRQAALKNINDSVKIDGFRQGNVPEKVLVGKVGEKTVLEEMAELALGDVYPLILKDENIDAIGRPEIAITKMAAGNPLEFKIKTATIPEITLGDYKKIAKETTAPVKKEKKAEKDEKAEDKKTEADDTVTEKDIDEALARVKKSHESHGDHEGHDHASFDTPEFRTKIKDALIENKRMEVIEKRRITIADKIVEASSVDLPAILVENEIHRIEAQFQEDISRMGVNLDDYLKHAKKTLEDLRKEWGPHAEKKAKLQLVLNKIAELENIQAEEKEIEAEVKHLIEHYKDADRDRAYAYAAGILTNEKVFQFLEGLNA